MGIKSTNKVESYYNYFADSGLDAASEYIPPPQWYGTRGTWAGGYGVGGGVKNVIGYVTIASTGNATDFGDTYQALYGAAGCSSGSRGLIAGGCAGSSPLNVIGYITFATTGNATDFGDLTVARAATGASSPTRGLFLGGVPGQNVVDYIEIPTTGNAIDFGNLTTGTSDGTGISNAHGRP